MAKGVPTICEIEHPTTPTVLVTVSYFSHIAGRQTQQRIRAKRSTQSKDYIGRTAEGLLIPLPHFKPDNFTVRELQAAIRAVRAREAAAKAG